MTELLELRQGDISYNGISFVYRTIPDKDGNDLVEVEVEGCVVLTQTCDIVRSPETRPFLEVCPLVKVKHKSILDDIRRGRRPRYAYVPEASFRNLVADLDG